MKKVGIISKAFVKCAHVFCINIIIDNMNNMR